MTTLLKNKERVLGRQGWRSAGTMIMQDEVSEGGLVGVTVVERVSGVGLV